MKGARAVLGAVLVVCLCLWTPALASARLGPKAVWGPAEVNGVDQFPIYKRLGVRTWQVAVLWSNVDTDRPADPADPNDPAYHWTPGLGAQIRDAARHGIRTMIELRDTAPWANGGLSHQWAPTRLAYQREWVDAAAREYPTVHLWMIYGEPNQRRNFMPEVRVPQNATTLTPRQSLAPRLYARLLNTSYFALKAIDRANLVIGGDTYTVGDVPPRLWIKYLRLPDGQPPHMDLYGHNPFSLREPSLANPQLGHNAFDFSDVGDLFQWVNQNLAKYGHPLKLYLAEWDIPTAPEQEFPYYVSLKVQAQWIRAAFSIVRGHPNWIYSLGWIHFRDDPPTTHGGLEYANGRPKPGFFAFENG